MLSVALAKYSAIANMVAAFERRSARITSIHLVEGYADRLLFRDFQQEIYSEPSGDDTGSKLTSLFIEDREAPSSYVASPSGSLGGLSHEMTTIRGLL